MMHEMRVANKRLLMRVFEYTDREVIERKEIEECC
jgi:hypothetical protein